MTVISDISRKMRTSMNTLNGMVTIVRERLARGGDAAETLKGIESSVDLIAEEASRMVGLVNDLSELGASKAAKAKPERMASDRFAGRRILLADDVPGNVLVISEMLSLCGASVTKAKDGQEALDAFKASEPGGFDCVIMDLRMPGMDGFEATAAIRALERDDAKKVPVIALSAEIFGEDRERAVKAGMNDCVTKPIRFAELAEVLEKHFA